MKWVYSEVKEMWEERQALQKEERKKQKPNTLISIAAGVLIALISIIHGSNLGIIRIPYHWFVICILISSLLHICIHETGHLIGGILSGYQFRSFQILCFLLHKKKDKYKVKLTHCTVAGQCLMTPPKNYNIKTPYLLYHRGGWIMNLISSVLAILLLFMNLKLDVWLFWLTFSILGFALGLINALAYSFANAVNDGTNIKAMRESEIVRLSSFRQLDIYGQLCDGKLFSELSDELLALPEDAFKANPINNYLRQIKYIKQLENLDLDYINATLTEMEAQYDELTFRNQYFVDVERLFYLLVTNGDIKVIKTYYKYLKKKMNGRWKNPMALRTLILYKFWIHKDNENAAKYIRHLKWMSLHGRIPQEAVLMIEVLKWALERKELQQIEN